MKTATVTITLDKRRLKTDKTYPIVLRVHFNGKRKRYGTGESLDAISFDKINTKGVSLSPKLKDVKSRLQKMEIKAIDAIVSIGAFTFEAFERAYFTNRDAYSDVYTAFDNYIRQLTEEGRHGTAESYRSAMRSLIEFKKDLQFAGIDKLFLTKYEKWMQGKGMSTTTTGIYLRSLRRIYNLQSNIDPSLYPFGERDHQYTIPTSRNIKKALRAEDIAEIYHAQVDGAMAKYRDYWMFLYLANGMNVADMCNLKHGDVDGDKILFEREKTKGRTKTKTKTMVHLTPQLKEIINRHGTISISNDVYLFPFLNNEMTDKEKFNARRQLTKMINRYMKMLAKELNIKAPITTMVARHSFATTLKRANVNTEVISEMMSHTSVATTKSYLESLDSEAVEKASSFIHDVLDIRKA